MRSCLGLPKLASFVSLVVIALLLPCAGAFAQTSGYSGASLPVVTDVNKPVFIAFDGAGNMYLTQWGASYVLELTAASGFQTQVQLGSGLVSPWGIAVDSAGSTIYVSGVGSGGTNGNVYKIDIASNTTTTLSTALVDPRGIALDSSGNLFVADQGSSPQSIWEFPGGSATPTQIYSGSDVNDVFGMGLDAAGDLFVTNSTVGISELANNAGTYAAPVLVVPATILFAELWGVTLDAANNLYMTAADGNIFEARYNGSGWDGALPITRDFTGTGIAFNPAGQLYVAGIDSNTVYRVFTSSVDFGTVAVGSASTTAKLNFQWTSPTVVGTPPYKVLTMGVEGGGFVDMNDGIHVCSTGTISDPHYYCLVDVQFQPTHPGLQRGAVVIEDEAGNVLASAYVYGTGKGPQAVFTTPSQTLNITGLSTARGLSVDGAGNLYAFETGTGAVDKIASGSTTATVIDTLTASSNAGGATAVDGAGNLFVLDGAAGAIYEYPGGAGPAVQVATVPESDDNLVIDGAGNLYFSGATTGAIYELKLGASSVTTLVAGGQGHRFVGIALDAAGDIYAADFSNNILYEVTAGTSTLNAVVTGGNLDQPHAVAVDAGGNIYVTNYLGSNVLFYTAGTYNAQLISETGQTGIALDGAGNMFTITGTDTISSFTRALGSAPPPSLSFTSVAQGGTSPDSPKTVALLNIGNAALNFTSIAYPTDFPVNSTDTFLCAAGTPLDLDAVCDLSMSFTPQSVTTLSESVNIQSDGGAGSVSLSGTGLPKPQVIVTPSTLTFGNQTQGTTSQTWHIDVKNNSTSSPLDDVVPTLLQTQPAGGSNFTIVNNTCTGTPGHGITIAPNTSCGMDITFTPSVTQNLTDNYAATLSISDDGLDSPQTVPITGVGTGINAFLAPSNLTFTNVGVNTTQQQTVTLDNASNGALTISAFVIAPAGPFTLVAGASTCPVTAGSGSLAANSTCSITVQYAPTAAGTDTATLTVNDNGLGGFQSIPLNGTATAGALIMTPSTLDFTNTTVGSTSAAIFETLKNNGNSDLVINNIAVVTNGGGSIFALAAGGTCSTTPITLAPNTSCTVAVTFAPAVATGYTGSLQVTLADNSVHSIPMDGIGDPINAFLAPSVLNFTQYAGSGATAAQSVTLDNPSNGNLTIGTIGTGSPYFQVTGGTCQNGGTVGPNSTCTILVTFNPNVVRSYTDTLTVTDNGTGGSQSIPLNGTGQGINAVLTPSSLNFTEAVGATSPVQFVTLTNPTQGILSYSSWRIEGGAGFGLAAGGTCVDYGGTLAPNSSCTRGILFHSLTAGSSSGELAVDLTNGTNPSLAVSLSANFVYPTATLTNNPLDFGSVPELTSVTQTATLRNTSDFSLSITATPQVTGGGFSYVGTTCGATLPAQSECTITVQFAPTAATGYTGTLTVFAGVAGGQLSVPLTGTGTAPVVSISPSSLDFGNVTLGTNSSAMTTTITNQTSGPVNFTSFVTTANFTMDSNTTTCSLSTPLAGGASCNVGVIFSPSSGNSSQPYSGTLTITDNASGGTQTIALSGTGSLAPAYSLSVNPQSLTIQQGGSGQVTFTMTPTGGFKGTVNLACNNLPTGVACSFAPSALTADGSNKVVTSQLTVTTGTVQSAGLTARPGSTRLAGILLFPALMLGGLLAWRRRQFSARVRWMALLLLGIAVSGSFIGCGTINNTAAPGSSSVTVTASTTASTTGGQTSQSVSFTLTIVK